MLKSFKVASAILLITFCAALPASALEAGGIAWKKYDDGIALAASSGKKVYVNFHADWCTYCVKMAKTTFKSKKVIAYLNDNFVSVEVDTEKEKATAAKYKVRGLPTHLFLESDGKSIGTQPGYLDEKQFLKMLQFIQAGGYKK